MNAAELAKSAREQLSQALQALQSNPGVPEQLLMIADPVADTMRVLHRIEKSNGADLTGREKALQNIREVLQQLQMITVAHPATEVVTNAVASSLSKVHALNKIEVAKRPVAPTPAPEPLAPAVAFPNRAPLPTPAREPEAAPAPSRGKTEVLAPAVSSANVNSAVVATLASEGEKARPAPAKTEAMPRPAVVAPAVGDGPSFDVELGTHSGSNFYKGLGGNDVVEHGGIFIATYKVPKIGTTVFLRVHMPGNYEFQASAVVQWTRDAGSSEPGFGARFSQVSPEGRQLIYRYTRNREPMFYDDL